MEMLTAKAAVEVRKRALVKTFEVVQQLARTCPPANDEIRARCIYCEKPGTHECSHCKSARYCSQQCQDKDWSIHRLLCSTHAEFTDDKRPSPDHARAIIFPAGDVQPRFIWIEKYAEGGYHFPVIDGWLGPYARYSNMITDVNEVLNQAGHGHDVGHGLFLVGLNEHPLPEVPLNASILSLGKPGHMKVCFGNQIIAARKQNEAGTRGITVDDVELRDLRHAVDFFQHHPMNPCVVNPERYTMPVMPGVIIHCDGSRQRLGPFGLQSPLESVTIPRHCLEDLDIADGIHQDACAGLLKLELRWFYRRYSAHAEWLESETKGQSLRNKHAKHMVYQMRKRDNYCCLYPVRNAGTIVVFDQGGAPIDPAHIHAINDYFDEMLKPSSHEYAAKVANGAVRRGLARQPTSSTIHPTMEGFKAFWAGWKEQKEASGTDLGDMASPYAIDGSFDEEERNFMAEVFEVTVQCMRALAM
ncbi:Uu.00g121170.m01.CDS01 [Anthostomella pinea]|uniref:Uu.00g121170.m01.CDS01 n=1 Tax=Anthostomella pinea TaxID=933095 RepID=A0AAI8YEV8_9PEZI|nr:Uu.00g121170.m01.CDS01 [Anthostomella pinea]